LYHGFSIRGYELVRTDFIGGAVYFTVQQKFEDLCCSACGSTWVHRKGKNRTRYFRSVPIGSKPVWIVLDVPRVECLICGLIRQVKIQFVPEERRTSTKAFARYALELCQHMTIKDVARHLGVSWDLIKDIHKTYLKKPIRKPRLKDLKQIAIDEIDAGKKRGYLTIVMDLETGAIVFVGQGKDPKALEPFWKRLKPSRARIKAVAIDMSRAYSSAVKKNLPQAKLIFDRFHVVKLYNEKLADFRRQLFNQASNQLEKQVLKGTRWLLVKNIEDLNEEESDLLYEALEMNLPLTVAYFMKEYLRLFWQQPTKKEAKKFLRTWVEIAESSGVSMLEKFAKTIQTHEQGILAWYDFPISTGPLEGTNNKIRTLQRQHYGFRDEEYFRYRLHSLHLTRYALVG